MRTDDHMPHQLPVCPFPENGEGLIGYRLRLAEANGYPSPFWLTSAMGKKQRLGQDRGDIEAISALTGYSVVELEVQFLGKKPIPPRFLNVLHPRVCPECLRAKPILLKIWDASLVVCCPIHGRRLLDICPGCGSRLSWNRPNVLGCDCGFDFRMADSPTVEPQTTALTRAIAAKIDGSGVTLASSTSHPRRAPGFAHTTLPLGDLLRLVHFLGVYGADGFQPRGLKKTVLSTVASALRIVDGAAQALADWPRGFYAMLDRALKDRNRPQALGARQSYGQLYHYLYHALRSDRFQFLHDAFETYLHENWQGLFDGRYRSLSNKTRERGKYISTTAAAGHLGMKATRVHALVRLGTIQGKTRTLPSGRTLALVERKTLASFADHQNDLLTAVDARKRLGITKGRFAELVEHEVIKAESGPKPDGSGQWRIPRANIDRLVDVFGLGDNEEAGAELGEGLITLRQVLQGRFTKAGEFPAFINAVERGETLSQGRATAHPGLGGILFRSDDVDRFLALYRREPTADINLVTVARYLGVKEQVIYHLAQTGLLKCRVARNGVRRTRLVSCSDLRQFQQDYITGAEISRKLSVSPRSLALRLQRLGVKALVGPAIDGSRQYVFPRQHALRAIKDC